MEDYVPMDFQTGDLSFWSRAHNPAQYVHCQPRKPHEIKDFVLRSKRIETAIAEEAKRSGRPVADVERDVRSLLDEIAHKFYMPSVRVLGAVCRKVVRQICSAIYINKKGIGRMEELMKKSPVVLLPSHRSYLDFLFVTYILYEFKLAVPAIASAQDFMGMFIVGSLLRQSGGFFMRRTFGSDQLYWSVFSEYMQTQLSNGDAPMEFFIEGTRSRTAKPLHPRLGLLSVVMDCFLTGQVADIQLVPISISYERTLEETLFARELLGTPKPKESTKGLFAARSILSKKYGSIFAHFGEPVSLHDFCQQHGVSRLPHSIIPRHMTSDLLAERKAVGQLGYHMLHLIQSEMRLPYTSLVATLMLHNTATGLEFDRLVDEVIWLRREIELRGGKLMCHHTTDIAAVVKWSVDLLEESLIMTPAGMVQLRSAGDVMVEPITEQRKETQRMNFAQLMQLALSHTQWDGIMCTSHTHMLLAHYRNQLLHVFGAEIILALILSRSTEPINSASCYQEFTIICSALNRDLLLPKQPHSDIFQATLWSMNDRGLLRLQSDGSIHTVNNSDRTLSFHANLVTPFAAGVWIVSKYMLSLEGDGVQNVTQVFKGAQFLAAKMAHTGVLHCYDVLSLDIMKNAMQSLMDFGMLSKSFVENAVGKERLVTVSDRIRLLEVSDVIGKYVLSEVYDFSQENLLSAKL